MNKKCIIIGAGTYGQVYLEYLKNEYKVTGFYDDDSSLHGQLIGNVKVKGSVQDALENENDCSVFVPIGNNPVRVRILKEFEKSGFEIPSFIHTQTIIHSSVKIGRAVYILPGTNIMPLTEIGDYSMISMGVNIAHHNLIGKGCFFSQGTNIGASININEFAYVGISATLMTGIKNIGRNSLIGAGAVAIFAATNHMQCSLVLHGAKEDFYCQSGNAKIMRLSGAKIIFVEEAFKISTAMDNEMDYYKNNGFNPYYIWGGGHTIEGGLAYIEAIANLKEYSENTNWIPDYIFLASGTGSTQAGILAGLDKYDFENTETIGISVARKSEYAQKIVNEFYLNLCEHFKIKSYNRKTIVVDDYISGGYGQFNNEIKKISDESIKIYGFTLDTCYTGKAFYGMLDYIKKNNIRDKKILFWHTGGVFNFLAE